MLLCVAFVFTIALLSCNKDFEKRVEPKQEMTKTQKTAIRAARSSVSQDVIKKIDEWLNEKSKQSELKKQVINSIKANLEVENIWVEQLNETIDFIVVPLKSSLLLSENKDYKNYLLFKIDANKNIENGYIVQYKNAKNIDEKDLPENTLSDMYIKSKTDINGLFVFRNFADKILYELDYENGNLLKTKYKTPKSDKEKSNLQQRECQSWYLNTYIWIINSDGTRTLDDSYSEYLGTTCNDDELDDSNSGGGDYTSVCNKTAEEVANILASCTFEQVHNVSIFDNGDEELNFQGEITKPFVATWQFLKLRGFYLISSEWTANFNALKQKSSNSNTWMWKTFEYSNVAMSDGWIPPCTEVNLSASCSTVIAPDKLSATATLQYYATVKIPCLFGVQSVANSGNVSQSFNSN